LEAVAIDPSGNIVVGGNDYGTAETFTLGTVTLTRETGTLDSQPISAGGGPIFELDANGNVIWGRLVATTGEINMGSLAIAGSTIYAAGPIIDDAAFAVGGAMPITGCGTAGCVYLAAYDMSGNIQWAKQAPSSPHRGTGEDPGEVWIAATTTSLDVAIGGYYSSAGGGSTDANELVVSQYDLTGALVWTKVTPSQDSPIVNGLALDSTGNLYVAGSSAGLELGAITTAEYTAPFFVKYAPTGDLAWGIGYPGDNFPAYKAIALSDHLYSFGNGGVTGPMGADSFDLSTGALLSDVPCEADQNLGAGVAASSAGVFVGGYGGPPATFGTKTLTALGLFVAKLK
ncbi:MAG: SBBP repeat-containing protein, partial [Polyangiaceae bacterium]